MTVRTSTVAALSLCAALGFGLYNVKYAVQDLDDQLVRIDRQIALDQAQIHVLHAEWSYLTQPARLEDMASRHLDLKPLTPAQLGEFDTLPLKGDDASTYQARQDVPIEDVLKAMQVAATPTAPATSPPDAARAVE
jgi:hypothetical protein